VKVVLFWSTFSREVDTVYEAWRNKPLELSAFHYLPLLSHVKFRQDVDLYTYQNVDASVVPKGITVKDASVYFPAEYAFNALARGHSIAHISDAIRLQAISDTKGVLLDCDAVMLKPFDADIDKGWFASLPAKVTGGFAPKWGNAHPPLTIHDNGQEIWDGRALSGFPMKASADSRRSVRALANKIMGKLAGPIGKGSKAWNYVLWDIKEIIKSDPLSVVYKPINFCPVPSWRVSGKCYSLEYPTRLNGNTELFGYKLPSIGDIFSKSTTVQHFFESAFQKAPKVEDSFWANVKSGSLVQLEAEYILGGDWRYILNGYANES
jgi:hypothetical protein